MFCVKSSLLKSIWLRTVVDGRRSLASSSSRWMCPVLILHLCLPVYPLSLLQHVTPGSELDVTENSAMGSSRQNSTYLD